MLWTTRKYLAEALEALKIEKINGKKLNIWKKNLKYFLQEK